MPTANALNYGLMAFIKDCFAKQQYIAKWMYKCIAEEESGNGSFVSIFGVVR